MLFSWHLHKIVLTLAFCGAILAVKLQIGNETMAFQQFVGTLFFIFEGGDYHG